MNSTFFETIKAVDGEVLNLSYHQERYESVLAHFGIYKPQNLKDFLIPPKNGLYRCRLTYDPFKMQIEVTYHEYKKREISSLKILHDDTVEYSMKHANRDVFDRLFALRNECSDILIVKNSLITDTSIANIAFFDGNRWITPATPLLRGTTRERFLREGKIFEQKIYIEDLDRFYEVALMNAMIDFDIIAKKAKDCCVR